MKQTKYSLAALLLLAGALHYQALGQTSPGYVDFGKFSPPANGGEFVEVNVRSNLIAMVARLAEKAEPDAAEVLRGLQLVRVNVIGLDPENRAEMKQRVQSIRADLDSKGWERIVTAQNKKDDIGVYLGVSQAPRQRRH